MNTKVLFLLISSLLILISCENKDNKIENPTDLDINSVIFTDCNAHFKSTKSESPAIWLRKQNDYLKIRAISTEFCCGTDSITISNSIDGDKINIEIIDNGPFTYCFCPHDVEFLVGPLSNGNYSLTFIESENSYSRDTFKVSFTFDDSLDTTITNNPNKTINHLKTLLGGCNGKGEEESQRKIEDEPDTVIFTVENDTLDIYVGVNYICCAPFISATNILNDSIIMIVSDTCLYPYQSCYCRCMCYYTWDFIFANVENKTYYYKVILNDPREENPITFKEGYVDL